MTPLTTEREYDVVVKALDERVKLTEALKKSHKDLVTMIDNTVYFKFDSKSKVATGTSPKP